MKTKLIPIILFMLPVFSCSDKKDLSQLIAGAIESGANEVVIPSGEYVSDQTIELNGVKNLVIKADTEGEVTVTSGLNLHLDDFTCLDRKLGLYEITLPELKHDPWPDIFRGYAGWPEIYIDGRPMILARYPDQGYLKIDSVIDRGAISRKGDSVGVGGSFLCRDLTSDLKADAHNIYLSGYWCYQWYDETIRIDSIDPETGAIQLAAPTQYGIGGPSGGLFYVVNAPEFLDQPGEYYYDGKTGTIRLIVPDPSNENQIISVGFKEFTLMNIRNSSNIRIEGFHFTTHNGPAVQILNSDSVELTDCNFTQLARSAIKISGGKYCGVNNSQIGFIGATGITLEGGDKASLTPARHYVTHCRIHDYARHIKTYAPAVNLIDVGHRVSENHIYNAPHNAILFNGNDHIIEGNTIERVCWDTSDAGAIYCGRDWTMGGTVIRNNTIRNLGQARHHHNWAIYLDDLASGIDVLNNTIEDCPSGILVGGGRYNRIIGNSIINCPRASIMYDARGLNWYQPYINDPDHTLWTRLRKIPVDQPPWSKRFPWLMNLANDDPAVPKHAVIRDNKIIHSAKPDIHPAVIKFGEVEKSTRH
ncbi:MAG: right-handed parallel beta-helix repeat-containing protein [Bacteroidales bacterium]|nr:right-handed parallel beta-helix repeat-containing protein [Bacteroidales bacterium]